MSLKKIGRPKKTLIDTLKTLIWYEYVADEVFRSRLERNESISENEKNSHKASFKSLETFFDQEDSNIWYKYSIGSSSPNNESLELVDNKISKASLFFKHPLWDFLSRLPRGKLELENFYLQLSEHSRMLLESGEVNCTFNFSSYADGNDYSKFENLLEFYSCIIYQYYKFKFRIKADELEKVYFYFSRHTTHIIDQFGATGYYFLKLFKLHLIQSEKSVASDFTIESNLDRQNLLAHILKVLKANKKRYEHLDKIFNEFRLDGDQYRNSDIYFFVDYKVSYPPSI